MIQQTQFIPPIVQYILALSTLIGAITSAIYAIKNNTVSLMNKDKLHEVASSIDGVVDKLVASKNEQIVAAKTTSFAAGAKSEVDKKEA